MPRVAFGEGVAPLVGAERRLERAVFVTAPHQAGFGIEQVFVIGGSSFEPVDIPGLAQLFRNLCNAPVVVSVFQRPGGALVDAHVVGHIAQRVVILVSEASGGTYRRVNLVASREHRLVERGNVFLRGDTLENGVRHDRGRVVAHHAAAMSRGGPFGQEAALTVGVGQPRLNLGIDRGIDEVQQRKQTSERIPKTRVGVHITRQHLSVVGTVMHGTAVFVQFVELAGKECRAVKARVERAVLVRSAARNLYFAKNLVPAGLRFCFYGFEIVLAQLLEIPESLFLGDERRGNTRRDLLAAARSEIDCRYGMFTLDAQTLDLVCSVEDPETFDGFVEADDEVIAEIFGHAPAVARRVTRNSPFVADSHARTAVEGVDDNAGLVRLGERKTHDGGTLRGCDFGPDVVVGQIDRIIVRFGRLRLVREPAAAALLVDLVAAAHGHHGELSVVVDPGRGLVRLLESADRMGTVGVGPAVTHLARLGRPEVHAPRQGHRRIGVARRERVVRLRTHECRNIFRGTRQGFIAGSCYGMRGAVPATAA